jgi:hypothetical protein
MYRWGWKFSPNPEVPGFTEEGAPPTSLDVARPLVLFGITGSVGLVSGLGNFYIDEG